MPTSALSVIGAGGHAAVVADAALLAGFSTLAFFSQDASREGLEVLGFPVMLLGSDAVDNFIVAIGNNAARMRLQEQQIKAGALGTTIVHPQASVSVATDIGRGSFIAAGAVVAPRSLVAQGVIVNHRAVVDHDCLVGSYSHIAPGAVLGGNVQVGKRALVGAGATILPGVCVGDDVVIGAGAVVLADVASGTTIVGVPGRAIGQDS